MKRLFTYILLISSIGFSALLLSNTDFCCIDKQEYASIYNKQQSDLDAFIDNANADKSTLPEFQKNIPNPSARTIHSHKKNHHSNNNYNPIIKHSASNVLPTNKYNIFFSFITSTKDCFIVLLRHLII